jgi:acyl-CoA thioesterase I
MWKNFLRGIITASVLVCGFAQADQTILVLGDSLSASYGLAQERGWVNLLQQRLQQEKQAYRVVNASISGETTSGGLYRINALLTQHRPKIVILELGANDGLRGLSIESTRNNLESMIQRAKKSGAKILLLGMRIPPNYGLTYTEQFHRLYEVLAKKYHIQRQPFFLAPIAGQREYFQADGLHPTAAAQPLLLNAVWTDLAPMLRP